MLTSLLIIGAVGTWVALAGIVIINVFGKNKVKAEIKVIEEKFDEQVKKM